MVSELFFSQLALIALLWLCCMLHWVWVRLNKSTQTATELINIFITIHFFSTK